MESILTLCASCHIDHHRAERRRTIDPAVRGLAQRTRGVENMTAKQKIELRLSQVRERLNEISGLEGDAFTDEIRTEAGTLQTEYGDLEVRHRAAIVAEPPETVTERGRGRRSG